MKKITVIVASFKEPKTIGRCLNSVVSQLHDANIEKYQIIQVSPDEETLQAGLSAIMQLKETLNYLQVTDPRKGKSFALNMALEKAEGEIVVLTDGDVEMSPRAIRELLKPYENENIFGVTGKPMAINEKTSFTGYLAHLLTGAADQKRKDIFSTEDKDYFTAENAYFPMSGYLLSFRNKGFRYDPQYIDDTFISLLIIKEGHDLAYAPKAQVKVKFPTTLKDYFIQRRRNIHGTKDIHKDPRFRDIGDERSFAKELNYALFPLKYATNLRELFFSLALYPLRICTWIYALVPEKGRGFKTWRVAETTKG